MSIYAARDATRGWTYLSRLLGLILAALAASCATDQSPTERVASTAEAVTASIVSIAVTPPNASIPAGVSQAFKATATLSNGKTRTLTSGVQWSVGNAAIATVGASGLVTGQAPGTVSVTATDAGISATATLTVTAATLATVNVAPGNKKIPAVGTTFVFRAVGVYSDGTKYPFVTGVTWASTNTAIATVAADGTVTSVGAGTAAITATVSGDRGTATVTVGTATLSSVSVSPATSSAPMGAATAFMATGIYSDGSTLDLTTAATWASADGAVAIESNAAGSQGVATPVSPGTAKITAKVAGTKGTATLTVTPAVLTSIAISFPSATLPGGMTEQLAATGMYSDRTTQDLTGTVRWVSSAPAVAVVSNATGSAGLAFAIAVGSATVTATDPSTGIVGTATLTVSNAILRSLAVAPASVTLTSGLTQQFTATGTYSDATTANLTSAVTWSSTSTSVATISNDAASAGLAVAAGVGGTTIAALDPTSGITATATLSVTAAALVSIAITPGAATVANGLSQQFTATGIYSDASQQNLTQAVTWSVTSGTATISNAAGSSGIAGSGGVGVSTIQAIEPLSGHIATATLSVTAAAVVSIGVTPVAQSMALGATQQFLATGVFSDETMQDLTGAVTWSTSNADATVSNVAGTNGLATAAALGTTTVTATYASTGVSGSTTLTVASSISNAAVFHATLTSGDPATGGYDFLAQTAEGLSGGDLYYVSGAFWANNYNQRGVTTLWPCPSVSSVTNVPVEAFTRFAVPATVGNCYVSKLHDNNRSYAVFRVDSMTSTTVTLSWELLPVPVTQLEWQHCENWQPNAAPTPTTTASTLTNWLALNPSIRNAMAWITTDGPGLPSTTVPYDQWPPAMQTALQQNFVAYWAWYAGGMTGADPTPVNDPPANLLPTSDTSTLTVISESDAQALYVKYLALTFVVELQRQVPWSLFEYDAPSLAELLDARKFFAQWTGVGYAFIDQSVVPAPPLTAAAFVAAHNFLCTDRPKTIAEAVFWTRNLVHDQDEGTEAAAEIAYWQYAGSPPVSRILGGTYYNGLHNGSITSGLTQWTSGCHGTTGLIKSLLRTLNIPVEDFDFRNPTITVPGNSLNFQGHAVPHFISEHLWMSHADDPYQDTFWSSILPFPIQALEISESQFFAWYPNVPETIAPIGQNMNVIWATYGDQSLLNARLTDLTTLPTPPDTNVCADVTGLSSNTYTCAEVESMGLLATLDSLATPYVSSGSSTLATDEQAIPDYYFPEAQFLPSPCPTCMASVCAKNAACCTQWSLNCVVLSNQLCGNSCAYCAQSCTGP
jgi:hypothetical protein